MNFSGFLGLMMKGEMKVNGFIQNLTVMTYLVGGIVVKG
jgi:hypothetical protein